MCGRYASSVGRAELEAEFDLTWMEAPEEVLVPRYNVAPTDTVAAVVSRRPEGGEAGGRALVGLRWGLVPSWSKGPGTGAPLINARSETVATKPAFRKAFAERRCLLPATGYYEWYARPEGGAGPAKQPFFIFPEHGPLAMAGIYAWWRSPEGEWLGSCAIITTTATDAVGHLHDRMPMTVTDRAAWLDRGVSDADELQSLLIAPADLLAHAVSTRVGSVRNDDPSLILPLPVEP